MTQRPAPRRTVTVTRIWEITSGEKNGYAWTLHGVEAVGRDGKPISATLKSFSTLPTGKEIEVEVSHHQKFGTEYTLRPVR